MSTLPLSIKIVEGSTHAYCRVGCGRMSERPKGETRRALVMSLHYSTLCSRSLFVVPSICIYKSLHRICSVEVLEIWRTHVRNAWCRQRPKMTDATITGCLRQAFAHCHVSTKQLRKCTCIRTTPTSCFHDILGRTPTE